MRSPFCPCLEVIATFPVFPGNLILSRSMIYFLFPFPSPPPPTILLLHLPLPQPQPPPYVDGGGDVVRRAGGDERGVGGAGGRTLLWVVGVGVSRHCPIVTFLLEWYEGNRCRNPILYTESFFRTIKASPVRQFHNAPALAEAC